MAQIPEFISVLRLIRDTYYPDMSIWHLAVQNRYAEIVVIKEEIDVIYADILDKSILQSQLTASSTEGTPGGTPTVVYNPTLNRHEFVLTKGLDGADGNDGADGADGESLTIDVEVADAAARAAYDAEAIHFTVLQLDNDLLYRKLSATPADWSAGSPYGAVLPPNVVTEAPIDGKSYVRKDGLWVEVSSGAQTASPTFVLAVDTGNYIVDQFMNNITGYTIGGWAASGITYEVQSLNAAVATAVQNGDQLEISTLTVGVDTDVDIQIRATATGLLASEWVTIRVTNKFQAIQADDPVIVTELLLEGDTETNDGWTF